MGELRIIQESNVPWDAWLPMSMNQLYSHEPPKDERTVRVKSLEPRFMAGRPAAEGEAADANPGPWFWFWELGPGQGAPAHSHKSPEVMYIQEGEITFQGKTYGPGTCIYVDADTHYGPFWGGPNGSKGIIIRAANTP